MNNSLEKIYNNKLNFNCNKIEKVLKQNIKNMLFTIATKTYKMYGKNVSYKQVVLSEGYKNEIVEICEKVFDLTQNEKEKISQNIIKNAILSGCKYKMCKIEYGRKIYDIAISLSDFFIAMQSGIIEKVDNEKMLEKKRQNEIAKQQAKKVIKVKKHA